MSIKHKDQKERGWRKCWVYLTQKSSMTSLLHCHQEPPTWLSGVSTKTACFHQRAVKQFIAVNIEGHHISNPLLCHSKWQLSEADLRWLHTNILNISPIIRTVLPLISTITIFHLIINRLHRWCTQVSKSNNYEFRIRRFVICFVISSLYLVHISGIGIMGNFNCYKHCGDTTNLRHSYSCNTIPS